MSVVLLSNFPKLMSPFPMKILSLFSLLVFPRHMIHLSFPSMLFLPTRSPSILLFLACLTKKLAKIFLPLIPNPSPSPLLVRRPLSHRSLVSNARRKVITSRTVLIQPWKLQPLLFRIMTCVLCALIRLEKILPFRLKESYSFSCLFIYPFSVYLFFCFVSFDFRMITELKESVRISPC